MQSPKNNKKQASGIFLLMMNLAMSRYLKDAQKMLFDWIMLPNSSVFTIYVELLITRSLFVQSAMTKSKKTWEFMWEMTPLQIGSTEWMCLSFFKRKVLWPQTTNQGLETLVTDTKISYLFQLHIRKYDSWGKENLVSLTSLRTQSKTSVAFLSDPNWTRYQVPRSPYTSYVKLILKILVTHNARENTKKSPVPTFRKDEC